MGTSAGGFGTLLNTARVSAAFGVRTDVVDDSGPPLEVGPLAKNSASAALWGFTPPPGCTSCDSVSGLYAFNRTLPKSRYALLSFAYDNVIAKGLFAGQSSDPLQDFHTALTDFTGKMASDPGARSFIVENTSSTPRHVVLSQPKLAAEAALWLNGMATDDPGWSSQTVPDM
jgi:hypothetical protein